MPQTVTPPSLPLLTFREVAHELKIGRSTLYRLIDEGRLTPIKIGTKSVRIPRGEVERYLAELIAAQDEDPDATEAPRPSANPAGRGQDAIES
jgi:excisionase family DNA binding protein